MNCVVFFFQAEDGIRDGHVTGVQTCALPILPSEVPRTNAFCRTAPSDRRSLRAICRAGTFLAMDLSSRTSLLVHSRRAIFLAAIVTISYQIKIPTNRAVARR